VQVDPVNPMLKPPGIKLLKPKCDKLLSTFAFKLNLRRYIEVSGGSSGVALPSMYGGGAGAATMSAGGMAAAGAGPPPDLPSLLLNSRIVYIGGA
jgi:hypothetical protein